MCEPCPQGASPEECASWSQKLGTLWVRRFFRAFSAAACTLAVCPTEGALPTAASPRDPAPERWGRRPLNGTAETPTWHPQTSQG